MQQLGKLYNARKRDKGIPSAYPLDRLLLCVGTMTNKWWEILVPAAAVIPEPRVVTIFIGPKAFVADSINLL